MSIKSLSILFFIFFSCAIFGQTKKPDFSAITDVKAKKHAFFSYLYPLIKKQNLLIKNERSVLMAVLLDKRTIDNEVINLCKKYAKKCQNLDKARIESLLTRVDQIPPSLVLAQAANESAWGTSRFATQANNYFGQWCFKKGCGLVPLRRNQGSQHEVRKFNSAASSVRAYLLNINTNAAYADLRKIRAKARSMNQPLSALVLAEGLSRYSERGEDYVKEIQSMIKFNRLVSIYDQQKTKQGEKK